MKFILVFLLTFVSSTLVLGQEQKSPAEKYFSDVELINQDGQKVRFYSDVLKNKVVVINTFFTTCKSICPPMNRNFEKIQEALGDRLGKDAFLGLMPKITFGPNRRIGALGGYVVTIDPEKKLFPASAEWIAVE
jgi:cytochrome oxidase Cu insertion factor (SCO1/SenC/PrrC family)